MAKRPRTPPRKAPPRRPPPRPGQAGADASEPELAEVPLTNLISALGGEAEGGAGEGSGDASEAAAGAEVLAAEGTREDADAEADEDAGASDEGAREDADESEGASVDAEAADAGSSDEGEDAAREAEGGDEGGEADAASAPETGDEAPSESTEVEASEDADVGPDEADEGPQEDDSEETGAPLDDEAAAEGATPPTDDAGDAGDEDAAADAEARRAAAAAAGVQLADELVADPEDDLRAIEGEASPRLVSIVESLLFAADRALTVKDIRKVLTETSQRQIQLALKHLIEATRERGVTVVQVAGGFQMRTHHDNAIWVQRLLQAKPVRLSRSQLETLSIVAYRQPITRPEIDEVRGVDSGAVLKALLERELIQIVGKKEEVGRPLLYGTTHRFLEFFDLRSLRDLPTLRDFHELSEESKATLRRRYGEAEAEALGQEVISFAGGEDRGDGESEGVEALASDEGAGVEVDGDQANEAAEANEA
ncbi:MAG: SMC-Scp complex subunit ScpB, partial [Myxococcales bacterium]|nr:SMC-Scp complex subunit ScpB [Myxococcales bacterium]